MGLIFVPIISLATLLINIYALAVFVAVILAWLVAFDIVTLNHPAMRSFSKTLFMITEPVFERVRRVIPPFNNIDFSPAIVLILLFVISSFLNQLLKLMM